MNNQEIIQHIAHVLDDNKATNIEILPVEKLSSEFETMIIATATSTRHVNSLSDYVADALKDDKVEVYNPKRTQDEWVVVDAGFLVIHLMTEKARDFYRLENLWHYHEDMDNE